MANDQARLSPRASILLVDDQPFNLLALEAVLGDLGHSLVKTGSGEEALRLLAEQDFAVVLLDVHMHGLDGFETARRLRARRALPAYPHHFPHRPRGAAKLPGGGLRPRRRGLPRQAAGAGDPARKVAVFIDLFQKAEQIRQLERHEFERKLAEENARFRALTEYSTDAVTLLAADGTVLYNSPSSRRVLGYEPDEFVGRSGFEVVHLDDVAGVVGRLADLARRPGATVTSEMRVRHKDGSWRWVECVGTNLLGEPAVAALVVNFRDITERRQATEALRESEERFRLLTEVVPQLVWSSRPDGTLDYCNPRWLHYTGMTPAEAQADGWATVLHPADIHATLSAWEWAAAAGEEYQVEQRLRGRDGNYRWFLTRALPLRDRTGRVVEWYGTSTDIDERKRAEQTTRFLADASARLAALVDYQSTLQQVANLAVPAFADLCAVDMLEEDGALRRLAVADVDPGRAELVRELLTRYPADAARPSGPLRVVRAGQSEVVPDIIEALAAAGSGAVEPLLPLQAVGVRSYLCVPLRARGRPLGALTFAAAESGRHFGQADLVLAEDLAHRATIAIENARLYRELRLADRRKDEFLAMLAHELRNPLAPIRTALHLLRHPDTEAEVAEQAGAMVERQVQTMVRLVDDLLDVSRITRGKIQLRTEPLDLATLLQRAMESTRPLMEANRHRLTLALPDESVPVEGDPTRLEQVFANLLNNAAKYTERGGAVWLEAERHGGEVVVRVRDTGFGIPAHVLPHVFELFTQADRTLDRRRAAWASV